MNASCVGLPNKRGLVGVLCALVAMGGLLSPSPGGAAPVELLVNGSFETGDFTGWNPPTQAGRPFRPWTVSPTGGGGFDMDPVSPQDGTFAAWNGFDGGGPMEFTLSQLVSLPAGHSIMLTWKHRIQWNFTLGGTATMPRELFVEAVDSNQAVIAELYAFSTGIQADNPTGDTGWVTEGVDLSALSGTDVTLRFREVIPQTSTGPGQIEFDAISVMSELLDRDGDGIPDDQDACPDSDLRPTVMVQDCDSSVPNTLFATGCTIADLIHGCASETANHGQFVSGVAHVLNELNRAGLISGSDEGAIQSCAARSTVGQYPTP